MMRRHPFGMKNQLESAVVRLGLNYYKRHIFLCTDAAEPKCALREQTQRSWDFLKNRLRELKLDGPEALIYRSKAACLRVCALGPIAVVYPEAV